MHVFLVLATLCLAVAAEPQTDLVGGPPLPPGPDPAVVADALSRIPILSDPREVNMLAPTVAQAVLDHSTAFTPTNGSIRHPIPDGLLLFQGISYVPFPLIGPEPVNEIPLSAMHGFFLYGDGERGNALLDGDEFLVDRNNMPLKAGVLGVSAEGHPPEIQFAVGDPRGGETSFLTAIHTMFVRRHNQFIQHGLSFEEARAIVEAELDSIRFNELLPALIGPFANCTGVPLIDQVDKTFAGAIFRIHPMINPAVSRPLEFLDVFSLRDVFFNPKPIDTAKGDLKVFIESLYKTPAFSDDATMSMTLNRFLFHGQPGAGHSLTVLNLLRGLDLGLSDFNSARVAVGLEPFQAFSDFVARQDVLAMLQNLYPGGPSTCPIWLCARAEKAAPGSSMGETASVWFRDQLCGLRRPAPDRPVASFSTIACETTGACGLRDNPFISTGDKSQAFAFYMLVVLAILTGLLILQ